MRVLCLFKTNGALQRHLLRVVLIPFLCLNTALALDVAGVKVDERARVANQELVLNGAGIRYAAAGLVRVYVAELYLPQKRTTPAEIAALPGAKRIHLVLLREINANDFSKGLLGGIRANVSQSEQQKHFDSLLRLGGIFGQIPSMKKGETITVDRVPGTGIVIHVNGKRIGEPFSDESFFHTLLQIWVGPNPIDSSLKPVLLGLMPSNDNTQSPTRDRY
ncbi:MAG: chalcone isomerase family protein [Burkholderiales bacterium]|nr:chalcone isomerase family protein [Burkholderiales bacterium]